MTITIGKFTAGVVTRQTARWDFTLLEPLQFMDEKHGLREVPVGFKSDLASIRFLREVARWAAVTALTGAPFSKAFPWLTFMLWIVAFICLALYSLTAGYNMRSSILHDWEYTRGELSRKECDDLFRRAQHSGDGTAAWRSWIFWIGVRLGGWKQYASP